VAKILIIDDEKLICEEFREILQEENHQVDIAFDGESGIKKVQESNYDLVFLDVLMPRMEGGEVFRKIKAIRSVPIVIMSGYLPAHKEKEVLSQGAAAVFKKPLDLNRVRTLIRQIETKEP